MKGSMTMNLQIRRKAIRLTILFIISYCAVGLLGALSNIYSMIQTGVAARPTILGGYHILLLLTVPFYFLPLAVKMNRLAKVANMKILRGLSFFLIASFAIFIFFNIIIVIVFFINPGFFS